MPTRLTAKGKKYKKKLEHDYKVKILTDLDDESRREIIKNKL